MEPIKHVTLTIEEAVQVYMWAATGITLFASLHTDIRKGTNLAHGAFGKFECFFPSLDCESNFQRTLKMADEYRDIAITLNKRKPC